MEGEVISNASTLGGFISGVLLCGFGYFLYTRIKKSRDKKAGGSGGSGGGGSRPRNPGDTHLP